MAGWRLKCSKGNQPPPSPWQSVSVWRTRGRAHINQLKEAAKKKNFSGDIKKKV